MLAHNIPLAKETDEDGEIDELTEWQEVGPCWKKPANED